jgi:hypothetical protein
MPKLTFTVTETSQGWMVSGSPPTGPFVCRMQALNLAQGMADAIIQFGGAACVVDDGRVI